MFEHILFLHKRSRLVVWWLVSIVFFNKVLCRCLEMYVNVIPLINRIYLILIFSSNCVDKLISGKVKLYLQTSIF